MSGFSLSLDRNAEIHIEARVKITTDPPAAAGPPLVKLSATCDGFTSTHTGASAIMYTLPADKQVNLQVEYVDKNGNPATVDGSVTWASSDPAIATVSPIAAPPTPTPSAVPPGGAALLVPGTKVGNCQVTAKADADMGAGLRELVTLLDVTVVAGEAVAGTITPSGEPVPIPGGPSTLPASKGVQKPKR